MHIREPNFFADPTHPAKCVAGVFFDMTKEGPMETRASKLDALRMKKYYSYFIRQNRTKSIDFLVANAMAPLNHFFGNHDLCSSNWCSCKAAIEKAVKE